MDGRIPWKWNTNINHMVVFTVHHLSWFHPHFYFRLPFFFFFFSSSHLFHPSRLFFSSGFWSSVVSFFFHLYFPICVFNLGFDSQHFLPSVVHHLKHFLLFAFFFPLFQKKICPFSFFVHPFFFFPPGEERSFGHKSSSSLLSNVAHGHACRGEGWNGWSSWPIPSSTAWINNQIIKSNPRVQKKKEKERQRRRNQQKPNAEGRRHKTGRWSKQPTTSSFSCKISSKISWIHDDIPFFLVTPWSVHSFSPLIHSLSVFFSSLSPALFLPCPHQKRKIKQTKEK